MMEDLNGDYRIVIKKVLININYRVLSSKELSPLIFPLFVLAL